MRHSAWPLLLLLLLAYAAPANAAQLFPALQKAMPQAEKVGAHAYTAFFIPVYDIALYAPDGVMRHEKPHAISIRYALALEADDILSRSVEEMKRQNIDDATLEQWKNKLQAFFPDVEEGTMLAALHIPGKETVFYKDGHVLGAVKDPAFGPVYMGIWLAENTSEPAMRKELLGQP